MTSTPQEELLPCPFCGDKADAGTNAEGFNWAGCLDIDCIGFMLAFDFTTVQHAIAAWNTRAALTHTRAEPTEEMIEALVTGLCRDTHKLPEEALRAWTAYETPPNARREDTKLRHAFMVGFLASRDLAMSTAPRTAGGESAGVRCAAERLLAAVEARDEQRDIQPAIDALRQAISSPPVTVDEVAFEAFLAGWSGARGLECIADSQHPADYNDAHMRAQDYAAALGSSNHQGS